jgi:chondroitin AC lyase
MKPTVLLLMLLAFALPAMAQTAPEAAMQTVKERMRAAILPRQPAAVKDLSDSAKKTLDTEKPDGSWADIQYDNGTRSFWEAAGHMGRLHVMARAWATPGQPLHHDEALKKGILSALDFWLAHDYQNPNWWWNEIGVPQLMGETLLLMEPELSPEQLAKGSVILARSKTRPGQGQNTVWLAGNTIVRGLLENKPDVVADAFQAIYGEVHMAVPPEEGIQPDYSFHQHGDQLYNGGYGLAFGNDVARYISYAWGTSWQVPADKMEVFTNYMLDGQQWMVRGRIFDYSTVGREITRAGKVAVPNSWTLGPISPAGAAYGILNAVELLADLPVPRRAEFRAFASRLRAAKDAPPLVGNRMYWKSDYMAHQRAAFFTSDKMLSKRMMSGEVVNDEGRKSFHLSDGATFIYRTGEEYFDIFPVWDWNRIPGTTAEVWDPMPKTNPQIRGGSAFVGGVSDGLYGMAAMHLVRDALDAKKANFYFDDGFVALGAGITDTSDFPVLTSVNQSLLLGDVRASTQGQPLPRGRHALNDVRWVLQDGVGYVFAPSQKVVLQNDAQTGSWRDFGTSSPAEAQTKDVFSLWIDHGAHPADAAYQYVVLPGTDARRLAAWAKDPPASVVSNTPALQAVFNRDARVLEAAFYRPGLVDAGRGWTVAVDKPCLLLMREIKGRVEIAVSNPENAALVVNVTTDRAVRGEGAVSSGGSSRVTFNLPAGDHAGSSVVKTFDAP